MLTKEKITQILSQTLTISYLEFHDDSAKHKAHAEAKKSGKGHYDLIIISPDFEGKSSLQRHRLVNQALKKEFLLDIHALSIKTFASQDELKKLRP